MGVSLVHVTMSSGVKVNDEGVAIYNDMKLKKNGGYRWITFVIKDEKEIFIDQKGDLAQSFEDFKKVLPEDEPRYGLVDIKYTTDDGRAQEKLTFVMWSPDDKTTVKKKMLYASSKEAIKKKMTGVMKELQANDMGDMGD